MTLQEYERDEVVDVLRGCRYSLSTNDLLDSDLEQAIRDALAVLGVLDVDDN